MRTMLATLVLAGVASGAAATQVLPADAAGWRALAARDLDAMRDALRANSPIFIVERDSSPLRAWAESGYAQSLADLSKVDDAASARALLSRYAGGFRDGHISLRATDAYPAHKDGWPGFTLRWDGSAYRVDGRAPFAGAPVLPPENAALVSCDGVPAEKVARTRVDFVFGNLDLSGRIRTAPWLLWDLGNPFAGAPPRQCSFSVDGKPVAFPLAYRPIDDKEGADVLKRGTGVTPTMDVAPWGEDRWWIGIPSFGNGDWTSFFAKVDKAMPELRKASAIVIDMRGNGGGNSAYASRLATRLYGLDLVRAEAPVLGPVTYRASAANRQTYANYLEFQRKDGGDQETIAYLESVVSRFDKALAAGDGKFEVADDVSDATRPTPPSNPVAGKIILLTDGHCNSACLDAMDLFTALPGTIHAGTMTAADTIFMDISRVDLPSGLFSLGYGHKAWTERPRGSNVPYRPAAAWTYTGDLRDNAAWKAWLETKLAGSDSE